MKNRIALFFGILVFTGSSCSEELKPTPYEYTKIFTGENSKTWKVKFLEQTLDGEVTDTFSDPCFVDDEYVLYANSDHTSTVTLGSSACSNDPDADIISDTWTFNNASATLTMVLPFFTDSALPFIVREAKKEKMELEIFFDQNNTESYRIHFESTDEN